MAEYDGFRDHHNNDTNFVGFPTTFSTIQLAPDEKLFIGNGSTADYLTKIEKPNERGVACDVQQHYKKFQTPVGGVPYYPTYILKADSSNCPTNSIAESSEDGIVVYPNPTRDQLRIRNNQLRINSIAIYNTLGQKVSIAVKETKEGFTFDVSHLPQGIYYLSIKNSDEEVIKREKILIQY